MQALCRFYARLYAGFMHVCMQALMQALMHPNMRGALATVRTGALVTEDRRRRGQCGQCFSLHARLAAQATEPLTALRRPICMRHLRGASA
jgi:hypothetical protein